MILFMVAEPDNNMFKKNAVTTENMFSEYSRTRDKELRDKIIQENINLVHFIAKKFANRGETVEDLVSVGIIGLLNAIDRFDPSRGIRFATFATPTIMGEIKRHFRDRGWAIKVPRKLQELNLAANKARDVLTNDLGRTPTVDEIANKINSPVDATIEALELGYLYELKSLESDSGNSENNDRTLLEDYIGKDDESLSEIVDNARIEEALSHLTPKERIIIILRFFRGMSQTEVAEKLGLSQMQVSRFQQRALGKLRNTIKIGDI